VATVLRDTLDHLYDGQRSGRWNYDQLHKTEKTHTGTLMEINLHREFGFDDGDATDYRIAGIQVDCKSSMWRGAWMLPPEPVGHLCLLLWTSDIESAWSSGLLRVDPAKLGPPNRGKRRLTAEGRPLIHTLWPDDGRLAENLLLHLDDETRTRILGAQARRGLYHGQPRINELFWSAHSRIVRRAIFATIGQQGDFMKRARTNGGSHATAAKGILVLGHQDNDPKVAGDLGLPKLRKGSLSRRALCQWVRMMTAQRQRLRANSGPSPKEANPVVPAPEVPRKRGQPSNDEE